MLRSRLDRIARDLDDEVEKAMKAVASEVEMTAKMRVPRRTGRLARSIHVEKETNRGQPDTFYVAAGGGPHGPYYGGYVELGTEDTPDQPFLGPAMRGASLVAQVAVRRKLGRLE